jgi:hypothetical protein
MLGYEQGDQMQKIAKSVSQPIFDKNNTQLVQWIKIAQKFAKLCNFQTTAQSKHSPNRRKFAQSGHPGCECYAGNYFPPLGALKKVYFKPNLYNE